MWIWKPPLDFMWSKNNLIFFSHFSRARELPTPADSDSPPPFVWIFNQKMLTGAFYIIYNKFAVVIHPMQFLFADKENWRFSPLVENSALQSPLILRAIVENIRTRSSDVTKFAAWKSQNKKASTRGFAYCIAGKITWIRWTCDSA